MGAYSFGNFGTGKSANEVFKSLAEQDRHENGHEYSGGIGMKRSFVVIDVPSGKDPVQFANDLIDAGDARVDDKWGPAGCVKVSEGKWYFFGWASS